ncbi:hypothetical protein BX600DRAFT_197230 [Xylariales sp. PMI_506]|nr:hypothetical protein BX600DRAFT_197230 [Xylariales sp. PMI_506]
MTWAGMLRKSTAPKPAAPKPQEASVPKPAEVIEPLPPVEPAPVEPEAEEVAEETPAEPVPEPAAAPVEDDAPKIVEPEVALPPPEDDLTKKNLEQLPDESHPPATATAASTAADSWDPRQAPPNAAVTPLSAAQASRPTASGYAATALKATDSRPARVPSYQRRVLEQEEAVRLPGNREVDRAAVQFGAFSLNGAEDDIDGDREEAETRAQPPSDSPVQPRASLPPTAQAASIPEAFPAAPAQKTAPALPQSGAAATPLAPPTGPAAAATAQRMLLIPHTRAFVPSETNHDTAPQAPSGTQQFGRFGQANAQEQSSFPPKPYDTFGQQQPTTSAAGFDSFPAPTTQAPTQPSAGAFSSAPGDYSSYYTADQHSRGSYNSNYYGQGGYGHQQAGQGHNEGPNSHQRPFGGYGASQSNDNLSQYPQSGAQQSRYGAAASGDGSHNSGHNTPNPTGQAQQQPQQQQQQQQAGQNSAPQSNLHQQQPPATNYPYGHPYYSSPYYAQYMNSSYGGYGQGGYGGGPYGKGGVYGQPHQYGMSHQYDHSSPASSAFGQSALGGRDSGLGSSIDNYGRAGSAQSGAPGLGNSGFGGAHDAFNRSGASYQSPAGQGFNGSNAQAGSASDDLKPYGETKTAGGPSPSLATAARPGSATNNTAAGQSGLPPPQSSAQGMGGYGGYPSHLQSHGLHGNQSGGSGYGLGGAGAQGHGNNPYGAYGNYGGNQGFGNYGGRQGWGNNY